MTFTTLTILTIIFATVAVVAMFFPRLPAVIAAYASLLCAHFDGAVYVDGQVLVFWGVATVIVLGLRMLQPRALVFAYQGHAYVALGTMVGVALGYVVSAAAATLILGGVAGAFLGTLVYMSTPASPRLTMSSAPFREYLSAKGLPCVVSCTMATVAVVSLIA